jgi:hypothetical protein
MCEIIKQLSKKTSIGYKVVLRKNGKLYSPYTGLEYVIGKVPELKHNDYKNASFEDANEIFGGYSYFNSLQSKEKLTAVFVSINGAKKLKMLINYSSRHFPKDGYFDIVKMKLSGSIFKGTYEGYDIELGNEILTIKDI